MPPFWLSVRWIWSSAIYTARSTSAAERRFRGFARREVHAVRVMEYQRAHARLRLHHHAFGEFHPDIFRMQQFPDAELVVEVRASRVAETVAFPSIARRKPLLHGHRGRIRK